jgi:hypothetical protein
MAPRTRIASQREYAIICNSRGLPALPVELLHHVASCIQEVTLPWYQERANTGQRNEKRDDLRTLSQLCRSLRTAFLPLVWQSLEAHTLTGPYPISRQVKGVGKELLGQLRLVRNTKQPYASYVRCRLFLLCSGSTVHLS